MPLSNSVSEVLSELSGTVSTTASLDTNIVDSLQEQRHLYDGFGRSQQLDTNFVKLLREQMAWLSSIWLVLGGIFCFFWIVALIWVIKDSNARSEQLGFQFFAVIIVIILTPIFGLPLYIACRPQGRKRDKSDRRTALLATLQPCQNCGALNPIDHTCCTRCGDVLLQTCRECGESYSRGYDYCPICGAPNIEK